MTDKSSPDDMLLPKPVRDRTPYIPVLPSDELSWLLGGLMPEERQAMAHICENASILDVEGVKHTYLIVPVTPQVLDTLAAFGAGGEDREIEHDDEIETDGSLDEDKEPDVDAEPELDEPCWHHLTRPPRRRPDPLWSGDGTQLVPEMTVPRRGAS